MSDFNINELVCLADINARYCEVISKSLPVDSYGYDDSKRLLALLQQNAFFRSVNIANTLLAPHKKELSVRLFLKEKIKQDKNTNFRNSEENLNDGMSRLLQWLDEKYPEYQDEGSFLYSFQNEMDICTEVCSHRRIHHSLEKLSQLKNKYKDYGFKDIRNNVTAHTNQNASQEGQVLPIEITLINKLLEITKELRVESYFWTDSTPQNHYEYLLQEHQRFTDLTPI